MARQAAISTVRQCEQPPGSPRAPQLGLVCITRSPELRFRTITRTRYHALSQAQRERTLLALYWDNLARLHWALTICRRDAIRLYRLTSGLFPLSDEEIGRGVLVEGMRANLSAIGRRAARLGIRLTMHPDQFVVLSSDSPKVVRTSITILQKHALAMDLMGLPRTPWAALTLHGGKAGRPEQLVRTIRTLPEPIRARLVLENDEYAYSAEQILEVCHQAGVPMVFDAHHHIVKERLDSYEHPSIAQMTRAARGTWPDPSWQMVHISNGLRHFTDPQHSDFISAMPSAFRDVPWIEVEAKAKEEAIRHLRTHWPPRT